jgi:DNA-binding NtrC family response regulator
MSSQTRNARQFTILGKRAFACFVDFRLMKTPVTLLLTNDPGLEDSVAQALLKIGGLSHLTSCAGDALQIICTAGQDLDLAVIDFEQGPHGMTLLSAINSCCEHFPVIVITREEGKQVEALAYANGAAACFRKPISSAQLAQAFHELLKPERGPIGRQLALAQRKD